MDVGTIASSVGALGVGSVLGQYLGGGRQRREIRAQVLEALRACESARWVGLEDVPPGPFTQIVHHLQAAALVARLPRAAVARYVSLAYTAHWLSKESAELDPEGGGISGAFDDVVRDAAWLLTDLIWRPWRARWRLRHTIEALSARANDVDDNDVGRLLIRAQQYWGR